jgi:actin-like ATPase involved in cell morphogenesis
MAAVCRQRPWLRPGLTVSLAFACAAGAAAQVVRPAGTFIIPIGGTSADLQTHGVMVSLRYAF